MLQEPPQTPSEIQLNRDLSALRSQISHYFQSKSLQTQEILQGIDLQIKQLQAPPHPEPQIHPTWPFCKNGHPMTWDRTDSMEKPCSICHAEEKPGFWKCGCGEQYCGKCYTPLFKKGKCPMGHALVAVLAVFEKCTVCSKTLKLGGAQDLQCRFSLCAGCREKNL